MEELKIIAYKGFDKFLCCRDMQYEIGKEYDMKGKIEICQSGFHACLGPLDVLDYYSADISRYCKVELSGRMKASSIGSKVCASHIKILEEVNILEEILSFNEYYTYNNLFSKDEQTYIANNFLGVISSKQDWDNVKSQCLIGSRMIILDGEYDIMWICVNRSNDWYYLMPENGIGCFPVEPTKTINNLYDSWLYNKILKVLADKLSDIFGDSLGNLNKIISSIESSDEIKITLPSVKETCNYYKAMNFTFFKICNMLAMFDKMNHTSFWLRSVVYSSKFTYSDNYGYYNYHDDASYRNFVRPLICIK